VGPFVRYVGIDYSGAQTIQIKARSRNGPIGIASFVGSVQNLSHI